MRPVPLLSAVSLVALFSACNAILGNESDYVLVPGGAGDTSEAGAGGSAGSSVTAGKGGSAGSTSTTGGSGGKGAGGKAGRGGSGNTGGKGGTGTSAGGASGEGGTQETAGQGGTAGGGTCEPTGAEDCFNGVDDDCNDAVDCEDAACDGPAECMPATDGADLGYFVYPMESCAAGFTLVAMGKDLQAGYECSGCSCSSPTSMLCDVGVMGLMAGTSCPGYTSDGNFKNIYNDRCGPMPSAPNIHYWTIRGTAQCNALGTPTLDTPVWAESMNFCRLDRVGSGCGTGQACLPTGTGNLCALTEDDRTCDGDFVDDHGTWHEGFVDGRTCGDCQCGLGTANCSGAYIGAYTDGGCAGTAVQLGDGSGAEGDRCALATPFQSGRIIGTPTNGSCTPTSYVSGVATPMGSRKACCQN